jgi:hypothetical protein
MCSARNASSCGVNYINATTKSTTQPRQEPHARYCYPVPTYRFTKLLEGRQDLDTLLQHLLASHALEFDLALEILQSLAQLTGFTFGKQLENLGVLERLADGGLDRQLHAAQVVDQTHVSGHHLA